MARYNTSLVDIAVSDARSLTDLIEKFKAIDPDLATQLTGKALIASKTPWGVLGAAVLGWLVSRYGLGWSEATTSLIDGLIVLGASYGMRYITTAPITSLVSSKT